MKQTYPDKEKIEKLFSILKEEFKNKFELWFKDTRFILCKDNFLIIKAPNKFHKESIELRFKKRIEEIWSQICGGVHKIEVIEEGYKYDVEDEVVVQKAEEADLNPKYTFDTFIIGECNKFAHASALAVANFPAKAYNPLFIYGGVGLGKTHLIQAIGNFLLKFKPYLRVKYTTTEKFLNDFIETIKDPEKQDSFKRRYRQVDILLIDDIQFLAGKEQTQVEFFHTFNSIHQEGKQIVLTSDKPPRDIPALEERLRSRFESGLITDIQPPNYETRLAILNKKAEYEGIEVPADVLHFIAENIKHNIRELEGALTRIIAYAVLNNVELNLELTTKILKDVFPTIQKKSININLIKEEVSNYFGISVSDLMSKQKFYKLALARQIVMYITREKFGFSLTEIGREMQRDHTTVLHACNKIKKLIERDTQIKTIVDKILDNINKYKIVN